MRRVLPAIAYCTIHVFAPVVRTRKPKPGRSASKNTLSVTPAGSASVLIVAAVSLIGAGLFVLGTFRVHLWCPIVLLYARNRLMLYSENS